jgi:pimeloyl-ACP methyl ester carboxylesterase
MWHSVQSPIAQSCARTLSYSRAGYGPVSRGTDTRDAEHLVAELRQQLAASGAPPPYVLVGHSLGGLYMQYFARGYARADKVPTIVLSSTRAAVGETLAFLHLETQLQNEIADAYPTRRHEFVADSGHYIQRDQPQTLINAVRELAGCDSH